MTTEMIMDVRKELDRCRRAQQYALDATRSQWVPELEALLEAAEAEERAAETGSDDAWFAAVDRLNEAMTAARRRAKELAEVRAWRYAKHLSAGILPPWWFGCHDGRSFDSLADIRRAVRTDPDLLVEGESDGGADAMRFNRYGVIVHVTPRTWEEEPPEPVVMSWTWTELDSMRGQQ